ncbi:MAG: ABC-F family ATP-binding cassette domain-containing protein [Saprospiraceae bacterium]|nr:ABC-F family ATP-binding cassette domain-containing protein [Saprospiraceae bacterium]MDP4819879.1 ABC-F family ATP-binding cassette domain-containing protein [Saprospiraceae bacterium]MDP4999565.1 ABC-F family ATP-binding cassette domain-containing protein [Saprospiraceae bacterium]
MDFLTLENVSKSYGEKTLFQNLSLQISKGQKIALVAKNGSGKTTLLRVIAGTEAPEGENSSILLRKGVRVGYLPQEPELQDSHTILEAVFDSDNEMIRAIKAYEEALIQSDRADLLQQAMAKMDDLKAWDFEAKIREILQQLNIARFDQLVRSLSGGQKKRLALAKLIIDEPEFLILDEPTNHLDLDMIEWLEMYLQQPGITLFMVTHDRYFLERVCNQIIELDNKQLFRYQGNYSQYLEKRAIRLENEALEYEKDKKLFGKELEWIRRMPQARTTKAKSRVDAFDDIKERVSNKRVDQEIQIEIKGQRLGKKILELHNISKSFGDLKILEGFSYKFQKEERVGIVGPNGVGKSTFLKLLTQEERVDSGKVVLGENTVFGIYSQDGLQLREDQRVIEVVRDIAEFIPMAKGQKLTAAQALERFLFSRPQQQVYVSQLSGGERRRLFLLTVLMRNPNFLILDEPTNDLDIVTLNILEEFLLDYPGCILIVSHDRYFIDKIATHLFVFEGNGKIKDFNGDYTEYREWQKEQDREKRKQEKAEQAQVAAASKANSEDKPGLTYEQRKELSKLEKEISKLEAEKQQISTQFNEPDISAEKITRLSKELAAINEKIEDRELKWMSLAEQA